MLLLALSHPALAFNLSLYPADSGDVIHWEDTSTVSMYIDESTLGPGFWDDIEHGVAAWDAEVVGSGMDTYVGYTVASDIDFNDGYNYIYGADLGLDCDDTVASTHYTRDTDWFGDPAVLIEADLMINADCDWSTNRDYYDFHDANIGTNLFPVEYVIIHEMGHVLSLDHEDGDSESEYTSGSGWDTVAYDGWPTIMGTSVGGGGVGDLGYLDRMYFANEDERRGLRSVYPGSESIVDLSVQSYFLNDGEGLVTYGSDCDMLGRARPSPSVDLLQRAVDEGKSMGSCPTNMDTLVPTVAYPIYQGATMDVTFSLSNLGTDIQTNVKWQIVLRRSGVADRVLYDTSSTTLNVNIPYERTVTVEIPVDTAPAEYTIVAEIDPDHDVDEDEEDNNVAVWNQKVEVVELPSCGCSSPGGAAPTSVVLALAGSALARRRRR